MSGPRPIRRPFPSKWYWRTPTYRMFMVRELTSVFVAVYLVFLLVWLQRLGAGPDAFARMVEATRHPLAVAGHAVVLAAALVHSITWFNLTPKIMPVYIGEDRVADRVVAVGMGYGPWLVVSAAIVWGVLR